MSFVTLPRRLEVDSAADGQADVTRSVVVEAGVQQVNLEPQHREAALDVELDAGAQLPGEAVEASRGGRFSGAAGGVLVEVAFAEQHMPVRIEQTVPVLAGRAGWLATSAAVIFCLPSRQEGFGIVCRRGAVRSRCCPAGFAPRRSRPDGAAGAPRCRPGRHRASGRYGLFCWECYWRVQLILYGVIELGKGGRRCSTPNLDPRKVQVPGAGHLHPRNSLWPREGGGDLDRDLPQWTPQLLGQLEAKKGARSHPTPAGADPRPRVAATRRRSAAAVRVPGTR